MKRLKKPADKGDTPSETKTPLKETTAAPATKQPEEAPTKADVKATPVASAIIADKGINPKEVKPSGASGKILKEDVLAALTNPGKVAFEGAALNSRNERSKR